MSERPFFSVCIPCFNHAKYVGKTIRSVLEQDFEDFEIVVSDNASTDDSRAVVKSFQDPRIRLIENRYNIGFAPNLQRVTQHARGRYINLLSSDDLMNPGALRAYVDLIAQQGADAERLVLMSQAWEIDGDDRITRYVTKDADSLAPVFVDVPGEEEILQQPHHEIHQGRAVFARCMKDFTTAGVFCSVAYSRELWESVEGYNSTQQFNPDKHFILKTLRTDPCVIFVNRPLYSYRRHQLGQALQTAREQVLKFQVDQYSYLTQFDDGWLQGTGVTREQQRRLFVNRDCLDHALVALADGRWTYASRLLAFAWSAYPATVIRQRKAWALLSLLACGPLGIVFARLLKGVYKLKQSRSSSLSNWLNRRTRQTGIAVGVS